MVDLRLWRRHLAVLLGAAVFACMVAGGAGADTAAAAESPIGAHSMLQLNDPPGFMRAMFAEAASLHSFAIRLDVAPALVFPAPGQPPDFSGLDEVMSLSQQYQLPVVADLVSIPWWIASCPDAASAGDMPHCATDDLADYGLMIGQIVAHADPVIRYWEVWNEPDSGDFFHGTPQQYALMLRAAHDAIKAVAPADQVLLGGISSTASMPWLSQVLSTPGADAAGAFDIANIHERAGLDALAGDVSTWVQFFAAAGFAGPLWVTEHGYPSDPAFQYDRAFAGGPSAQAAYLATSIPTLLDAGAQKVFVTERDNLDGPFASEGVLSGAVGDPPVDDPQVTEKPSFAVVQGLAACYVAMGRACAGAAPAAAPSPAAIPPTPIGATGSVTVTISDPAFSPLQLGTAALAPGPAGSALSIAGDGCSGRLLEPDRPCTVDIQFRPVSGGPATAVLNVPSGNGTLALPVSAVAPSVSSLVPAWRGGRVLAAAATAPVRRLHAVVRERSQRLGLRLTNPLSAAVRVSGAALSGPGARRYRIVADTCRRTLLAPAARCTLSLRFTPARHRSSRAVLTLHGAGRPLTIPLAPAALASGSARRAAGSRTP